MGRVKPLTDTQCRGFKPKDKEYKNADGDGLYLHIKPNGSKLWRLRIVIDGKQTTKSLGIYPATSLKDVRLKRDDIKSSVAKGIDPFEQKSKELTFIGLVDEFFEHNDHLSENYIKNQKNIISNNFYPTIGEKDVSTINSKNLIDAIKSMNGRGVSILAKKVGSQIDRVFRYVVTLQYIEYNPMRDIDISVLVKNKESKNYPHISNIKDFADLLKSIDDYTGDKSTRLALQLAPYVFVRPFNIRYMEWDEINFDDRLWTIDAKKMKMKRDHIVHLTDSMIEIIKSNLNNGSRYVFNR